MRPEDLVPELPSEALLELQREANEKLLLAALQAQEQIAEARRLNEALGEAEHVLRSLVDNLPELAWSAFSDGYVDFLNERWYRYTGTTFDETGGWGWEKVHAPELLPNVLEGWRHSIQTGEPFEMEFPLRRADGEFRWFITRIKPLRNEAGKIVRWFGISTDIHDQRAATQRAEEASLAKDQFLATASHELRTPLNAILGWARMLRSGQLDPNGTLRAMEIIERNALAQVQLIEDILDGSRIISGKLHLEIRPLDMTALVRAAIDAVRPAAEGKKIELSVVVEPAAARIVGDPDRLQQVVWNLANNAIKFTPKGGNVEVRLERTGTSIQLVVKDSGQGIAPDFLAHVFERFRQADGSTTRRHGGLGLGLALVRHLVEAHGGTVRAESEGEGRGAAFIVTLPVQAVFAERAASDRPPPLNSASPFHAANLSGVTVLVVDDEADARDLVATVLRTNGAEVTTASTAERALELLSQTSPMILLSDIGMPGTDGYELIRRVRTLTGVRAAAIPAIALTAYARDEDRRRALEAGFQTHVAKPVEPAELLRVVSGVVEYMSRQSSPRERESALGRADVFLKFEKLLETHGIHEALRFLNSRTPYRFTSIKHFDPPTLRSLHLVDSHNLELRTGADVALLGSPCAIVGETQRTFTTENAQLDDRLRAHSATGGAISYCGVLLRNVADGKPFGTLCHYDLVAYDVPAAELPLMEAASPYLMRAMQCSAPRA